MAPFDQAVAVRIANRVLQNGAGRRIGGPRTADLDALQGWVTANPPADARPELISGLRGVMLSWAAASLDDVAAALGLPPRS